MLTSSNRVRETTVTYHSRRAKVDVGVVEQGQQYTHLSTAISTVADRLSHIDIHNRQASEDCKVNSKTILTAVESSANDNIGCHAKTQGAVSQLSTEFRGYSDEILLLATGVVDSLKSALDESRQQHAETLQLLRDSREEGNKHIEKLTSEIQELKMQFEQSVQLAAASAGRVSPKAGEQLMRASCAKFELWAAKELVLNTMVVSPA